MLTKRPSYRPGKGDDKETPRFRVWLDATADHLIAINWGWIARTAQALLRERTLTVDEVRALKPRRGHFPYNRKGA